jgi:hypothetical protein
MRRHASDSPGGLTGYEAVEFLDIPPMGESRVPQRDGGDHDVESVVQAPQFEQRGELK